MTQPYKDLHEEFPELTCEGKDGYCNSDWRTGKTYSDWEREIATPYMTSKGFSVAYFYTVEGDSFGPLIRGVEARDTEGNLVRFFYG